VEGFEEGAAGLDLDKVVFEVVLEVVFEVVLDFT
jgi:hypothetical protein